MDKNRRSATKRRLTQYSVCCAIFSALLLLGATITEQKASSLKDTAQDCKHLSDKLQGVNETAQVVWEFSRVFRDLKDIKRAVDFKSENIQVADTNYFWARSLALVFTYNGASGFTNLEMGLKTRSTNLLINTHSNLSVEGFNAAYRLGLLELINRKNLLFGQQKLWADSLGSGRRPKL